MKKEKNIKEQYNPLDDFDFEDKEFFRKNKKHYSFQASNHAFGYAIQWFVRFDPSLRSLTDLFKVAVIEYIKKNHKKLKKPIPAEILEKLDEKY